MTIRRITNLSVSTLATKPLRGLVEIRTVDSTMTFELSEDLAHAVCVELEHFLTQQPAKTKGQQ